MPIRVLVNGAEGKMGRAVVKAVQKDEEFKLVAATGKDDDLANTIKRSGAEVVIDFTAASVGFVNASTIIAAGAHPVIGTSGFLPDQVDELKKRCAKQKLGGIIAPNFSISAILMMQFAGQAAKYFPQAEIIEMHHTAKEDSPSGTALRTAQLIAEGRQTTYPLAKSREVIPHARGATHQDVAIHAVRLPGFTASQMILFGGKGETFTLRADTYNRECYMPGVKLACKKVLTLSELVYGLEHLL